LTISPNVSLVPGGTPQSTVSAFGAPRDENIVDIRIEAFQFMPFEAVVPEGSIVRWTNYDFDLHDTNSAAGGWASPSLQNLETFQFQTEVNNQGIFPYVCTLHGGMTGVLIVVEAPDPAGGGLAIASLGLLAAARRRRR
jgi:MYXO-CTERM domain-containing protein